MRLHNWLNSLRPRLILSSRAAGRKRTSRSPLRNSRQSQQRAELLEDRTLLSFQSPLDLSSLLAANGGDGSTGFVAEGTTLNAGAGTSVTMGDITGDGISDLIIGAPLAGLGGEAYVIFGDGINPFPADFDASSLDGSNGFTITAAAAGDKLGNFVSFLGDVDGDGIGDLGVGAVSAAPDGLTNQGATYVIFGRDLGGGASFGSSLSVGTLNGSDGFSTKGLAIGDGASQIAAAGDLNDDGVDDIVIGASGVDNGPILNVGNAYVVFGRNVSVVGDFASSVDLSGLDGTDGFVLEDSTASGGEAFGVGVSRGGDFDGDGIDDLLIGAGSADFAGRSGAGAVHVVFGKSTAFAATFDVSTLDGSNGLTLEGATVADSVGYSNSSLGDFNGDGTDDLLIGVANADPFGRNSAGKAYVVYGGTISGASFDLGELERTLTPTVEGFVLFGGADNDRFGEKVSGIGDINNDGLPDLAVSALLVDPDGLDSAGQVSVLFGRNTAVYGEFPATIEATQLHGSHGFVVNGLVDGDFLGRGLSNGGDVNGDGIDDLVIGSERATANGASRAGQTYVIFGQTQTTSGAIYRVTNTADSGPGSLRQAILDANANPGKDTIVFNIPAVDTGHVYYQDDATPGSFGSPVATTSLDGAITDFDPDYSHNARSWWKISVATTLPEITDSVVLDATSQFGSAAGPLIELDGSALAGFAEGLLLTDDFNHVEGLIVNGYTVQVSLDTGDSSTVAGNYLGIDASGTVDLTTASNSFGVEINNGSNDNRIGGAHVSQRNIIGGQGTGIQIQASSNAVIENNYIGTDVLGTTALANDDGVALKNAATNIAILGNLISGNDQAGIRASGAGVSDVAIDNNLVGTDRTGLAALGNSQGVLIDGATYVEVDGNVISGNTNQGVAITRSGGGVDASDNVLINNIIGLDINGDNIIANNIGVLALRAFDNVIGRPGEGNVISGNTRDGVEIWFAESTGNVVQGNKIGTDIDGLLDRGNGNSGVYIHGGANSNTIGGTAPGAGNLISGNTIHGVFINDPGSNSNTVQGNVIGLDSTGNAALGNGSNGVMVFYGQNNLIGGSDAGAGNIVSANTLRGIEIGGNVGRNTVQGNYVGLNVDGDAIFKNNDNGIRISTSENIIGGLTPGAGNVVSGNDDGGIFMSGTWANDNQVLGNFIGTNPTGTAPLGNIAWGVYLSGGDRNLFQNNVISGNQFEGIYGSQAESNEFYGNRIGTDITGLIPIANGRSGILLRDQSISNIIGGPDAGEGNVISGNLEDGIKLELNTTHSTTIQYNLIGVGSDGETPIGNRLDGISVEQADGSLITDNTISSNLNDGLYFSSSTNNRLFRNRIGTSADGQTALGNGKYGIELTSSSSDNIIGGPRLTHGNIVSANGNHGIYMTTAGTQRNTVQGNLIGTDIDGLEDFGNSGHGISIEFGGSHLIGTDGDGVDDASEGNVISGNQSDGVFIGTSQFNKVAGNLIGVGLDGFTALPNFTGVRMDNSAHNNVIGTDGSADPYNESERNILSGNSAYGVWLWSGDNNKVSGNYIGTDSTGTRAVGNQIGVVLTDVSGSIIGTDGDGTADELEGNVISGQVQQGITLGNTAIGNTIAGNIIGLDVSAKVALGNDDGIFVRGQNNTIGSNADGTSDFLERNIVSGNRDYGLYFTSAGATGNVVAGNLIGTDGSGNAAIENVGDGIYMEAPDNTIGGTSRASRNVISGNAYGINVRADRITIQGNFIGVNADGDAALPNDVHGILINLGTGHQIGGTEPNAGNVISGHRFQGIDIGTAPSDITIEGNRIGTSADGSEAIPNRYGIRAFSDNLTIGGVDPGAGNLISGNQTNIYLTSVDTATIQGNLIGTDITGKVGLGDRRGIYLVDSDNVLIGGSTTEARNVISGHTVVEGIRITRGSNHRVLGNFIGTDITGTDAIPNFTGIRVENSTGTRIGGDQPGEGNVISGNVEYGVALDIPTSVGTTTVQGNLIGVDYTGKNPLGNNTAGIYSLSDGHLIGGATAGAGNVIAANGVGIYLGGVGQRVLGNRIGTNITGTNLIGTQRAGIEILSGTGHQIGGIAAGEGNIIRGHEEAGISVIDNSSSIDVLEHTIRGNVISTNGGQSIDLRHRLIGDQAGAITVNDPLDADGGPNGYQNYPVLIDSSPGATTRVAGYLETRANKTYLLDVYTSMTLPASGQGEAERYIGTFSVTTDASGRADFDVTLPGLSLPSEYVTLTATGPEGTSEFSQAQLLNIPPGIDEAALIITIEEGDELGLPTEIVEEGREITLSGLFDNPDVTDTHTIAVNWGDGSPISYLSLGVGERSFSARHIYREDSKGIDYPILVAVTDDEGATGYANRVVLVENAAPTFSEDTAITPIDADEGDVLTVSGKVVDLGIEDRHTVTIDWGDGASDTFLLPAGITTFTRSHVLRDDPASGVQNVSLTVEDDEGASSIFSKQVTVSNVAPIASIVGTTLAYEGDSLVYRAQAFDPGLDDDLTYFWVASSGGSVLATSTSDRLEIRPVDEGVYLIQLVVQDDDGGLATVAPLVLNVLNVKPQIDSLLTSLPETPGVSQSEFDEGQTFLLQLEFSDPGVRDTHTVIVDWGDGEREIFQPSATKRTLTIPHAYADDPDGIIDTYPIRVEVIDNADAVATQTIEPVIHNVAPLLAVQDAGTDELFGRLNAAVNDPGADSFTYEWSITTGDGSTVATSPTDGESFSFERTTTLTTYVVTLKVEDDDAGISTTTVLFVAGTDDPDTIGITSTGNAGEVEVAVNGQSLGTALAGDQIIVASGGGNDLNFVSNGISTSVAFFSGGGDDTNLGGDGDDFIDGGVGNDTLVGNGGNDTLIGASGNDSLRGGDGNDSLFLIPGSDKTIDETGSTGIDTVNFSLVTRPAGNTKGVNFDLSKQGVAQEVDENRNTVTIFGEFENVVGTDYDDLIIGSKGDNALFGDEGADTLIAGISDDPLNPEVGNDSLSGGQGDDSLVGGTGSTGRIFGDEGADTIVAGSGNDVLVSGGSGDDSITGSTGNTGRIFGDEGADTIIAGDGLNTEIDGGTGDDSLVGGAGDAGRIFGDEGADTIIAGSGSTEIDGGLGDDSLVGGTGTGRIFGDEGADTIIGGSGNEEIGGGLGDDSLVGGTGSVGRIFGDEGADTIIAGTGNVEISGGSGDDSLIGGTGNDGRIFGDEGADTIVAGSGNVEISGGTGDDSLVGGDANVGRIFGDEGADTIIGGTGNTDISGGAGDDSLVAGTGNTGRIFGDEGADTIIGGSGNTEIRGGSGADSIIGSTGNDGRIFGEEGADTIVGGGANVEIHGGSGDDSLDGGTAIDGRIFGEEGADTIIGGSGNSIEIHGNAGDDSLIGGTANEGRIFGEEGADTLIAGTGTIELDGGSGDDSLVGGSANGGRIFGDEGADTIVGGTGNSDLIGGRGDDSLVGGTSNDGRIFGDEGADTIIGGTGSGEIRGGSGDDSIIGSIGNDGRIFGEEGADTIFAGAGNTEVHGGLGDDSLVAGDGNDGRIFGDEGADTLIAGSGTTELHGGADDDSLMGGSGNAGRIFGDEGSDTIVGGTAPDTLLGGAGDDSLVGGSGSIGRIYGGTGSDTIVSGSADEIIVGGSEDTAIVDNEIDWVVESADTNITLTGSLLTGSGTSSLTGIDAAILIGGDSDNTLDASGFTGNVILIGGDGDDSLIGGVGDDTLAGGRGDDTMVGGDGNDMYRFVGSNLGSDTVVEEGTAGSTDSARDALDFTGFFSGVSVDLSAEGLEQTVSDDNLTIKLMHIGGIEQVNGTQFVDTLIGDDFDNYLFGLGSEDLINGAGGSDVVQAGGTTYVLLDFDSATGPEDHVYTAAERAAILERLQSDFDGLSYEFTLNPNDLIGLPHSTIVFNETPVIGGKPQPGGEADRIGWRGLGTSGRVIVDVNGFLTPNRLPPTSENFIALSATIAGHELGHLAGLRHHDALGPIGNGIFAKLSPRKFRPVYDGPQDALGTANDLLASPLSVGSSLSDALGDPSFGARALTKLAFAETGTVVSEVGVSQKTTVTLGGSQLLAQDLGVLPILTVPTLKDGSSVSVRAIDVQGRIELGPDGRSESDVYSFTARAGNVMTIEILSDTLSSTLDPVDTVLRLYDSQGHILEYYGSAVGAFNDDGIESTESLLLDVKIPHDGVYFIEVDTFSITTPEIPYYLSPELVAAQAARFPDWVAIDDIDQGTYELFMYSSSVNENAEASGDSLVGGAGADTLIGSSGADKFIGVQSEDSVFDGVVEPLFIQNDPPVLERFVSLELRTQTEWQYAPDVVDPDGDAMRFQVRPLGSVRYPAGLQLNSTSGAMTWTPTDIGLYGLELIATDVFGNQSRQRIFITVANVEILDAPETLAEGSSATLTTTISGNHSGVLVWQVFEGQTQIGSDFEGDSFDFTAPDNGRYTITVTLVQDGVARGNDSVLIGGINQPPTPKIDSVSSDLTEGATVTITASATDPAGANDPLTYAYAVYRGTDTTAIASDSGSDITSFSFVPIDEGEFRVVWTATDDEGEARSVEQRLTIQNVAPHNVIVSSTTDQLVFPVGETRPLTASFADKGILDTHSATWMLQYTENGQLKTVSLPGTVNEANGAGSVTAQFTPTVAGVYQATVTVTDNSDQSTTSQSSDFVVYEIVGAPESLDEGSSVTLATSLADSHDGKLLWRVFEGPNQLGNAIEGNSFEFTAPDNGTYTVTASFIKDGVDGGTSSVQINGLNTDPVPTIDTISSPLIEGSTINVEVSASDAAGANDPLTYAYAVYFGNETTPIKSGSGPDISSFSFVPVDNGSYRIVWTATDDDQGSASDVAIIQVANANPNNVVIDEGVSELVFPVGATRSLTGSFEDAGTADTHTATWTLSYFDGEQTQTISVPGTVTEQDGSGTVRSEFSPTEAGIYTVTLTVTDQDDGSTTSLSRVFVVYSPANEFVTGGGWFETTDGDFPGGSGASGKANFGLNAKYQKNSNVPSGQFELHVNKARFRFQSESFDWLVVSGPQAILQGTGSLGDGVDLKFQVVMRDGQLDGTKADRIRVVIWNPATGAMVYDSQLTNPEESTPGRILGGGQLVIHRDGKALNGNSSFTPTGSPRVLSDEALQSAVTEAVRYWSEQGVAAGTLAVVSDYQFEVAELPGTLLGLTSQAGIVWIDRDGIGLGWDLDNPSGTGFSLLAAVTHEVGHIVGFDHDHLQPVLDIDHAPLPAAGQTPSVLSQPVVPNAEPPHAWTRRPSDPAASRFFSSLATSSRFWELLERATSSEESSTAFDRVGAEIAPPRQAEASRWTSLFNWIGKREDNDQDEARQQDSTEVPPNSNKQPEPVEPEGVRAESSEQTEQARTPADKQPGQATQEQEEAS